MKIAHLTTVDMSLRFLLLPQLEAALEYGESIGISAPGNYVEEIEERGVRHISLDSSTRGVSVIADLRAMAELWAVIRSERPDVLHTHNPKPGVYGRILGRLAGVPIVVNTIHGIYATSESPLWKRMVVYGMEGVASRFSDAELVQNPEDMDLLRRLHLVAEKKLRLLGNGVDLRRFDPEHVLQFREETRSELGVQPDQVVVGMVGRLVAEKGLPELIEAARLLDPAARVVVAGPADPDKSDALGPEVFKRAESAGVQFLGMRQDVEALYGAFDVFVLPSHREGFPRAAMEAAASGLPVVATDIRGCRQVVDHGVNGLLVPVRDHMALAQALQGLVLDPETRHRMGKASAGKARRSFDEGRVVEIVVDTYKEVAHRKGLDWAGNNDDYEYTLRTASAGDEVALARLHSQLIEAGFLSSLGPRFLRVLYRELIRSDRATVLIAEEADNVVGFIAGTEDTGAFYREFLRGSLLPACLHLLSSLLRPSAWRRAWETLRYGTDGRGVSAELLSMAVAPRARGQGVGSELVRELLSLVAERGTGEMKVVVGEDNQAAMSLYRRSGFSEPRRIEVHAGVSSVEMVWRSSAS